MMNRKMLRILLLLKKFIHSKYLITIKKVYSAQKYTFILVGEFGEDNQGHKIRPTLLARFRG